MVIAIIMIIVGLVALSRLPVAQYPEITPPMVAVSATYTGANAVNVEQSVATPVEQKVNGVENMIYMSSKSSDDGKMTLTVTFEIGTDIDMATVLVQNRVSQAEPKLPEEVKREGITTKKKSTAIVLMVNLYSPDESRDELYISNYINLNIKDVLTRVAGVGEVVMTVPTRDGALDELVLAAAHIAGVDTVFSVGGAQAVAALAFGTATVPTVDKIVGPGNAYVAEAKRQLFGVVGIDMVAGPSEILVLCDAGAPAEWIAMDLFSQAEHDELAQAILITTQKAIATKVNEQIAKQLKDLKRVEIATKSLKQRGAIILAKNIDECIELSDRYAPEHLVIATDDADKRCKQVQNAGAIFLGHYTPVAVGDYIAGPNHVLPTGGTARFFSPLGVEDFLKRTSVTRFEPPKLRELGLDIMRLAELEGLSGHGRSVDLRLQKIRRARREREAAREAEAELGL